MFRDPPPATRRPSGDDLNLLPIASEGFLVSDVAEDCDHTQSICAWRQRLTVDLIEEGLIREVCAGRQCGNRGLGPEGMIGHEPAVEPELRRRVDRRERRYCVGLARSQGTEFVGKVFRTLTDTRLRTSRRRLAHIQI